MMRPAIGRGVADRLIIFAGPRHIGDRRVVVGREAEMVAGRFRHVLRSHMRAIIVRIARLSSLCVKHGPSETSHGGANGDRSASCALRCIRDADAAGAGIRAG